MKVVWSDDTVGPALRHWHQTIYAPYGLESKQYTGWAADAWVHIVYVVEHDGTDISGTLYVDGVEIDSGTNTTSIGTISEVLFGYDPANDLLDFPVRFRHFCAWSAALTPTQVTQVYNAGNQIIIPWIDYPETASIEHWASFRNGLDADYSSGDTSAHYHDRGTNELATLHVPAGRRGHDDPWVLHADIGDPAATYASEDTMRLAAVVDTIGWNPWDSGNEADDYTTITLDPDGSKTRGLYDDWLDTLLNLSSATQRRGRLAAHVSPTGNAITLPVYLLGARYYCERTATGTVGAGATTGEVSLSSITDDSVDYAGCWLQIIDSDEGCEGEEVLVASVAADGTLTLSGTLSAAPVDGDTARVYYGGIWGDHHGIPTPLERTDNEANPEHNVLERVLCPFSQGSVLAVNESPYHLIEPNSWAGGLTEANIVALDTSAVTGSIDVGVRQLWLGDHGAPYAVLDDLWDSFLISGAGLSTVSSKVVHQSNVQRVNAEWNYTTGQTLAATCAENGTWRETARELTWLGYDEDAGVYRGLLRAEDADSTLAYGLMTGTWDDDTDSIDWVDDTDADNPIITQTELEALCRTAPYHPESTYIAQRQYEAPNGEWWWIIQVHPRSQDYYTHITARGGMTRYDAPTEVDIDRPIVQHGTLAPDQYDSHGGGRRALLPDRDFEVQCVLNAYDPNPWYWATGRAQIWPTARQWAGRYDALRCTVSLQTRDGESWSGMPRNNSPISPHRVANQVSHFVSPVIWSRGTWGYWQDGLTQNDSNLQLFTSDDRFYSSRSNTVIDASAHALGNVNYWCFDAAVGGGRHVAWVRQGSDGAPYTEQDRILLWVEQGREVGVEIADGETEGSIITAALEKPSSGWQRLRLNAALGDGAITVEVLDPLDADRAVTGYEAADVDAIEGGTAEEITWGGNSLSELDAYNYLRLKFNVTRPVGGDDSPELYEWYCGGAQTKNEISSSGVAARIVGGSIVGR
jgi:hypothetical protein